MVQLINLSILILCFLSVTFQQQILPNFSKNLKGGALFDHSTRIVAYKNTRESTCVLEFLKNDKRFVRRKLRHTKSDTLPKNLLLSSNKLSQQQILRIAGRRVLEYCRGFPTYLIQELKSGKHDDQFWKNIVRNSERQKRSVKHYFVGRVNRGQTQSQYLNFGNGNQPGKAEAESTAGGSKALVTGTSGMGQAQSQSSPVDCGECAGQNLDNNEQWIQTGTPGVGGKYQETYTPPDGYGNGEVFGPRGSFYRPGESIDGRTRQDRQRPGGNQYYIDGGRYAEGGPFSPGSGDILPTQHGQRITQPGHTVDQGGGPRPTETLQTPGYQPSAANLPNRQQVGQYVPPGRSQYGVVQPGLIPTQQEQKVPDYPGVYQPYPQQISTGVNGIVDSGRLRPDQISSAVISGYSGQSSNIPGQQLSQVYPQPPSSQQLPSGVQNGYPSIISDGRLSATPRGPVISGQYGNAQPQRGNFAGELSGNYGTQTGQAGKFSGIFSGNYEGYGDGALLRPGETGDRLKPLPQSAIGVIGPDGRITGGGNQYPQRGGAAYEPGISTYPVSRTDGVDVERGQYPDIYKPTQSVSSVIPGQTGVNGIPSQIPGQSGISGFPGQTGISSVPGPIGISGVPSQIPGQTRISSFPGQIAIGGVPGQSGISSFPGQTSIVGVPGQNGISGFPGQTRISGIPGQTPDQTGISSLPGQTGIGSVPGQTRPNGFPGQAGIGSVPGQTGISGFPGQTGISGFPGQTGIGSVPGQRGISGFPGQTGIGSVPGQRGISGFPGQTGIGSLPGQTGISGFPGQTDIGSVPGQTEISGFPGQPGISGFPSQTNIGSLPSQSGIPSQTNFVNIPMQGGHVGQPGISNIPSQTGVVGYPGGSATTWPTGSGRNGGQTGTTVGGQSRLGGTPQYPITGGQTGIPSQPVYDSGLHPGGYPTGISPDSDGYGRYGSRNQLGNGDQYGHVQQTLGQIPGQGPGGYTSDTYPGGQVDQYGRYIEQYSINQQIDDSDSQAQTSVQQTNNETQASASSQGRHRGGTSQSQVSGNYAGSGSFSASAGSDDGERAAKTQVSGGKEGATSTAQGRGGLGQAQAQVQLSSDTGDTSSSAQSGGWSHGTQTQVQASGKGGMADAQATGPGSTSSQAQIGFAPQDDNEENDQTAPYRGGGTASAQGGTFSGQTQSQVQGKFLHGIKYVGAAQAGSGSKNATNNARNQQRPVGLSGTFPTFKPLNFTTSGNRQTQYSSVNVPSKQIKLPTPQSGHNADESVTIQEPTQLQENSGNENIQAPIDMAQPSDTIDKTMETEVTNKQTSNANPETPQETRVNKVSVTNPNVRTPTEYDNGDYDDEGQDEYDDDYEQPVQPMTKNIISQKSKNQKQHIILDPLEDLDATVEQSSGGFPSEGTILQPGQAIPGSPGYQIPRGFRGRVKSVASPKNTYTTGKNAQAQTVTLTPGTGKVHVKKPIYAVASKTHLHNGQISYGSGYTYQPVQYHVKSGKSLPNFLSVTKSETGSRNPYTGKKTPSVYYTQSSSCGVFTNTCVFNSSGKICIPKPKTNPDGTVMGC